MDAYMAMWDIPGIFARDFVQQMNKALANDDWEEMQALYREGDRIKREISNVMRAYNTMRQYSIKVG